MIIDSIPVKLYKHVSHTRDNSSIAAAAAAAESRQKNNEAVRKVSKPHSKQQRNANSIVKEP